MERRRSCHQSILACRMSWKNSTYSFCSKMLQASFFLIQILSLQSIRCWSLLNVSAVLQLCNFIEIRSDIHDFTKCLWVLSLAWGLQTSRENWTYCWERCFCWVLVDLIADSCCSWWSPRTWQLIWRLSLAVAQALASSPGVSAGASPRAMSRELQAIQYISLRVT